MTSSGETRSIHLEPQNQDHQLYNQNLTGFWKSKSPKPLCSGTCLVFRWLKQKMVESEDSLGHMRSWLKNKQKPKKKKILGEAFSRETANREIQSKKQTQDCLQAALHRVQWGSNPTSTLTPSMLTFPNSWCTDSFLMLWPFNSSSRGDPNHKIIPLLLYNCNFATFMNNNLSIWHVTFKGVSTHRWGLLHQAILLSV